MTSSTSGAASGGGHSHDWRLVFRGSDGLWYCTGCRITEPFKEPTDDE